MIIVMIFVMTFASACGGRVPSPKAAQNISKGFFKSYGRKYKTSEFGNKNLDSLAINGITELHFNAAEVDAIVALKDGRALRALITMEKDFPIGWHVTSWEKIQ